MDKKRKAEILRQAIICAVSNCGGCKATELAAKPPMDKFPFPVSGPFLVSTLDKMVKDGDIVEIEYCRTDAEDKVKSFLLPKGSRVLRISNWG